MSKILLLKGIPASGKSTFCRELIDKNPEKYKRINKDDLRAMLDNGKWSKKNEQCVLQVRDLLIQKFMEDGYDIIVDDTNLDSKHEKRMREIIDKWNKAINIGNGCDGSGRIEIKDGLNYPEERKWRDYKECPGCLECKDKYELEVKFFDVSLSEAIDRDNKRTIGHVGQKVIRGMYERYIAPLNKNKKLEQDSSLPHCIIVDIDGTVAEKGDRSPFDWSRVSGDKPIEPIAKLVKILITQKYSEEKIIFFSGRKECCMGDTITWINKHIFNYEGTYSLSNDYEIRFFNSATNEEYYHPEYQLFMRKDDDDRNDAITKRELFEEHIRNRFYVDFVLDDRDRVVKMWRELGLTCLQVCEGSF